MSDSDVRVVNLQSVQAHLSISQSVIQRMAGNSSSCKTWCITLVSAILVVVVDKGTASYAWIAVIPNVLFLLLDSYYLALERMFRASYNKFVERLHTGTIELSDVYVITPSGSLFRHLLTAMTSIAVWPFYLTLLAMTWLVSVFII